VSGAATDPRRAPVTVGVVPLLVALAAITAAAPAAADGRDDRGVEAITDAALRAHVSVLASDAYRGRFPATAGEDSTLAYLERQFRSLGLEPAVPLVHGSSYRQRVPLVRRRVLATPAIALRRAGGDVAGGPLPAIRWGDDLLLGSTLLDTGLVVHGAPIVFAGYGISAPELGWDDYAGLDCRGKVVLALGNDPGRSPPDSSLFGGRALTHYGLSTTKQEMAAAHGAVGLLLVHDAAVDGYPFDILAAAAGQPKFGLVPDAHTTPRTPMIGSLRKEPALELLRAAGLDPAAMIDAAGRRGFRARPLGITIDVDARIEVERTASFNLLGLLRGARRPDEVVIYSAHWDHMGVGVPVDGDSIYNGAVDNATGTAALLMLARAFRTSGHRPARSVLFFATTCEEQGLLGSYYYADHPIVPLERTVALVNMDALFPFGASDQMVVTGFGQSELDDLLRAAAAPEGRVLVADESPENGAFYRSDHYPLAKKGVPAIFAVGVPREGTAGRSRLRRYVQSGYHKPQDALTSDWDTAGILQDVRCDYRLGRALADGAAWPRWRPASEFRAARDAMRR
jgi:Zn-dependent M28 family amino/carboxypeptidase